MRRGTAREGAMAARAAPAAVVAVLVLSILAGECGGQSVIPKVVMTIEPLTQEVDASSGAAEAVYNCSVFVEGIPLVRYRVNLTADCEGWESACSPNQFLVSGSGNNSFTTTVKVPAGAPGGDTRQLTVNATVTTTGVPLVTSSEFAILSTAQSYGVKLSSDTSATTVGAGQTVTWRFGVKNNGNGRDSFSVQVVNLQSYTTTGWTLKFNRTIMSVDVGDVGYAQVNITPPNTSKNQTVQFQISAYSRGAKYANITIEDKLELALDIVAVPGGGGGKPPVTPKPTPGAGLLALSLALALAALAGMRRRK
jgi:hypothetical protein